MSTNSTESLSFNAIPGGQACTAVQYSMTKEKGDFEHFSGNASTPHLNPRLHIEKKGEETDEFRVQYNFTRVKYTASRDVFPEKK